MAWHVMFNHVFWINEWIWSIGLNSQGCKPFPPPGRVLGLVVLKKASLLVFNSAPHPGRCPEALIFPWHSCCCCIFLLLYSWKGGFSLHYQCWQLLTELLQEAVHFSTSYLSPRETWKRWMNWKALEGLSLPGFMFGSILTGSDPVS